MPHWKLASRLSVNQALNIGYWDEEELRMLPYTLNKRVLLFKSLVFELYPVSLINFRPFSVLLLLLLLVIAIVHLLLSLFEDVDESSSVLDPPFIVFLLLAFFFGKIR